MTAEELKQYKEEYMKRISEENREDLEYIYAKLRENTLNGARKFRVEMKELKNPTNIYDMDRVLKHNGFSTQLMTNSGNISEIRIQVFNTFILPPFPQIPPQQGK